MSDTEVLEVGGDRRRGLPRRVRALLLAAALVLGVAAYIADREVRERERESVAACADDVATSVDMASRRLRSAYEYIRPSLGLPLDPEFEAGIFRVVAGAAEGAEASLAPRETCAGFSVLPWHDDLQERRARCLEVLDAHRVGLAAVADDGKALREWMDLRREC